MPAQLDLGTTLGTAQRGRARAGEEAAMNPERRLVTFEALCVSLAAGDGLAALPDLVAGALRSAPKPIVLTDFAGRDSVAAAMAYLEDNPSGTLVPVGDMVPTRFGDWSVYESNWVGLRDQVAKRFPDVVVVPWFAMEDVDAWRLLNGRYINALIARFGFFTPCLGCHLHFYMMRTVLAEVLGATVLLSGEKEVHRHGRRKANQTEEAVQAYRRFSDSHGVDQRFPIHKVASEQEMARLLGDGWKEGERQLPCVMSGNDRSPGGTLLMTPNQVAEYMDHFAVPLATELVSCRRRGLAGAALQRHIDGFVAGLLGSEA
jgi:hypothetical protein